MNEESDWKYIKDAPVNTPLLVVLNGIVQHMVVTIDHYGMWWDVHDEFFLDEDFNPSHFMELPKFNTEKTVIL